MSDGNPTYSDAVDVLGGLARLKEDLADLTREVNTARVALRAALRCGSVDGAPLDPVVRQLSWLAQDAARMAAALAGKEAPHAH